MHTLLPILAQEVTATQRSWLPVVLLLVMAIGFAVTNVIASHLIGPRNTGPGKETTYESGMMPIGSARKRFNVRFYIVAMVFLVFDVEIIFFYPWATLFGHEVAKGGPTSLAPTMLLSMGIFVVILLVAYVYAWGKGVFRWD